MHRTRIKICGIMRPEDAHLASEAGADAIGMIFHPPSRRNVDLEQARQIIGCVGPFVMPVGVFVDAPLETIRDTAGRLGLGAVQLHGQETPQQALALKRAGLRVVKAIRVEDKIAGQLEIWRQAYAADQAIAGIVLETGKTAAVGGSGVANDWGAIRRLQEDGAFDGLPPVIAAGGLYPDTVAEVVRQIRPWAVDVSSGVESSLGCKSPEMVQTFIAAVRNAQAEY